MNNTVRFIVRTAIFGAVSAILYCVPFLSFNIPLFPPFLKFHFDEIPLLIAGFAYGPWVALAATFLRAAIKLPFDIGETMGVGVLADLVFTAAFILPASFIYKYKRNFTGTVVGISAGMLAQIITAMVGNVYVMIPFYMFVFNLSEEALLGIMQKAIPAISNIGWSYALFAVLPFNIIKDAIVVIVTLLVYKPLHRVITRANEKAAQ